MFTVDFQNLYELLDAVLPNTWDKVVFRAEYRDGSYSMKYYVKDSAGEYTDCFSIPGISEDEIVNAFIQIDKILFPERQQLSEEKRWNVLTMVIDSDGQFKTYFSYDNIDLDYNAFIDNWKKLYLVSN